MNGFGFRMFKRLVRNMLCRRPLIPKQPGMIVRIFPSHLDREHAQHSPFLALDATGSDSFRHIFDFPSGTYPQP